MLKEGRPSLSSVKFDKNSRVWWLHSSTPLRDNTMVKLWTICLSFLTEIYSYLCGGFCDLTPSNKLRHSRHLSRVIENYVVDGYYLFRNLSLLVFVF